MKVAVVGAGALGAVYGVRLARHGGVDVAFVVRPARIHAAAAIVIERVRGGQQDRIEAPELVDRVPDDADVTLLAIGTEDLNAVARLVGTSPAPVIALTPMFRREHAAARARLGDRVFAAMPSIIAYTRKDDGVVRYWHAPAPTRIEEPRPAITEVAELAEALGRAGIRARLELGVDERDAATTASFIALGMAVAVAGGDAAALAADEDLATLTSRACREGVRLGDRLGQAEPWARLAPVLATPWALRLWLGALGKLSPEALFYFEEHFGRKLRAQHRVMLATMIELARERRLPHEALRELAERLTR